MTFFEKLKEEHPDKALECLGFEDPELGCPEDYGYQDRSFDCAGIGCTECWNREMPETKNDISKGETKMEVTTRKTKKELLEEIAELEKQVERAKRYEQYDESAAEIKAMCDSFINAGFNHDAAFALTLKMIETAGKIR